MKVMDRDCCLPQIRLQKQQRGSSIFTFSFLKRDLTYNTIAEGRRLLARAWSQAQWFWWSCEPVFIFINRVWSRAEAGMCVFNGPVPGNISCGSDAEMKDVLYKQIGVWLFFLMNQKK